MLVTVIACTAFSMLCAQQQLPDNHPNQTVYISGNGASIVGDCRTFIEPVIAQLKTACYGENDAVFEVTFLNDVGGEYYFYWPSLATKGVSKNDVNTWFKHPSPALPATYTVPSGTWTNGFEKADEGKWLYVYSKKIEWIDSVKIEIVKEFSAFDPGAITAIDNTVCAGGQPNDITVGITHSEGSGTYTFEWYKGNDKINGVSDDATTYTPSAETATGVYEYTRKVIDAQCGGVFSTGTYTLTVNPLPEVTTSDPAAVCFGDDVVLTAPVSVGTTPAMTWTWNVGDRSAATTTSDTYSAKNVAEDATTYSVTVENSNGCNSATAATATITVHPLPVATVLPSTICYGETASLSAELGAGTTTSMTYTWNIAETTSTTTANAKTSQALNATTTYTVQLKNDKGCVGAESAPATITVRDEFNPGAITSNTYTICEGGAPAPITGTEEATGGDGAITYKWTYSHDGVTVVDIDDSGTQDYTLPPSSFTAPGTYHFQRWAKDGSCKTYIVSANTYTLVVLSDPAMNNPISVTGPGLATICYDTDAGTLTANLSPIAVGDPYTYTWQKWEEGATTWTEVSAITASTYAPGDLIKTTAFRVSATGSLGCAADFSDASTITVYPQFSAGSFSSSATGTVCVNGEPVPITASDFDPLPSGGSGSSNYTYEWYRNGNFVSTDEYYKPTSETVTGVVTYTRKVFDATCNSGGEMTAGSYILTVQETTPVILTAASTTICYNTPATIATTTPVTDATIYTWESSTNGLAWSTAIGTPTSNSFTTGDLTVNTFYRVKVNVNNPLCPVAVSGAPATITVYDAFDAGKFLIPTGGTRLNECPDAITGVSAPTGGGESYTYAWYKNGEVDAIDNATEATYWPPLSDAEEVGDVVYTRQVTETICGNTAYTSGSYILKVGAAPTTNIVPADTAVCNNASFNLTASAYSSGTYAWTESADGGASWQDVGGTTNVLSVPAKSTGGVYYYKVTITTDTETITSATPATVTVYEPLHGGAFQISSGTVCASEVPSTIYADAPTGGSGSYTYQWYATDIKGENEIQDAEEASYRPNTFGIYYRTVTDAACTGSAAATTTGQYTLVEGSPMTTNLDPVTLTVCNEGAITIATDAHATGTYTWFESTDGIDWGSGIVGQTTNVLDISRSDANTYYYKVVIAGASGCSDITTSTPATVTVRGAFEAGTLPVNGSVCAGGTPETITATVLPKGGDSNFEYQWYEEGELIPGATAATYQPEIFSSATTVAYTRQVKDGTCATDWEWSTNSYTLTVTNAPTVILQSPATATVCNAGSFTFTVNDPSPGTASGHAWEYSADGNDWISAGTYDAAKLEVSSGPTAAGTHYYRAKVTVNNGGNCTLDIYSDAATVTVRETLNAGVFQVTAGAICPGVTPAAITGVSEATGGDGAYTYQWYKDNDPIQDADATAATYQPETFSSAITAVYTRSVIDGCTASSITIGSYTLTVSENATSTINITPAVKEVCNGVAFTLTSGEPASAESYTWEKSTDGLHWSKVGTDNKTLDALGESQAGDYYYKVTVKTSSTCSPLITSVPATVTVREAFNAGVFQVTEGVICPGATPAAITGVSDPTGGDGNYTYQWYKDNDPIKGATAATYQPETFSSEATAVYTRGVTDNLCGEVRSGSYTLTVSASSTATINLTPVAQDVCNGGGFDITSGEPAGALGYTWYGSSDGSSWTSIVGQTTKTLTLKSEATAGDYYYKVMVQTGSTCSPVVASTPATVTVHPPFSAGTFKSDAGGTVCVNGVPDAITADIQETAPAGSGNYTYEWFRNGDPTGITSEYFTPAPETVPGAVTYTRMVTGGACGSDWTAGSYILTVKETPTVTLSATNTTICYNRSVNITASTVTGTTYTSYIWESSTDGAIWAPADGMATPNPLRTANLKTTTFYRVTAAVNDVRCPVAVSDAPATITVRNEFNPGAITSETYTICAGGTPEEIVGTAAAGGDETITYTWTYSNNGTAATITHNNQNYTPPPTSFTAPGTYHFQRWAKDGTCSTYTAAPDTYTLVVLTAPSVTVTPPTQPICYGESATFTVNVTDGMSGSADTYTWQQKNANENDFSYVEDVYGNTFTSGTISEETAFRVILTQPNSGCSSTASTPATVTLNQEPLTYTAPADISGRLTDTDMCSVVLTDGVSGIVLQGTYTAACPMDSLYYTITGATTYTSPKTKEIDPLTSYTFNKGVSIVTYTAKTAEGRSISSSFSIEVIDKQLPVITCASKDVYLDENGKYTIDNLSELIATANDNCGTITLYETPSGATAVSFDCADVGTTNQTGIKYVEVRARDASGNNSLRCSATVTVRNNQPPVAVCKPADTVYISVNNGLLEASRLAAASSTVLCGQQLEYYILADDQDKNPTNLSTTFACTDAGTKQTVYVGVKNMVNGEMAVCSTEVLVTDTVLTCTTEAIDMLYLKSGCSYTLVPVDDGDFIPLSLATPYYEFGCNKDKLGSKTGLWLENDQNFNIYQVPFQSPAFAAGTHEITWTLKDAFGDRATCKDVFEVVDTIRPTFTSATWSEEIHSLSSGSCTFPMVALNEPLVNDNCTGVKLNRTDNVGILPLDLPAGTYLIQYVAEDVSGNVSKDTSKLLITIVDENEPNLAAIADTIMQVDNDTDCFATAPVGGLRPVISNVCTTGMVISYDYAAGAVTGTGTTTAANGLGGATFTVGATAVTYTVTAANGSTATRTFTVNVQDTVKPKIACKPNQVRKYDNSGSYTVNGTEFDVTVAEKCSGEPQLLATIDGGVTTYSTLKDYVFYGAPSFTVEWTATDAVSSAITSTCSFTVTMRDTIPPVFTAFPDTIRVNTAMDACAATVTAAQLTATYTDNVTPESSITVTHKTTYKGNETPPGTGLLPNTSFPCDTTEVTYTIEDAAGNTRDSSFLVIVTDSVPPKFDVCPPSVTGFSINAPSTDCVTASPVSLAAPVYSDNCGTVKTLSWSITGSHGAKDTSGVDAINKLTSYQFAAGTNTVRYTATDASGNTAACSFTVEVADNVPPVCQSLPVYTLKLQNTPTTTLDAQWIDKGSTDNCGALTYRLSNPANATFSCTDIGKKRSVRLVVSDEFGNENTCGVTEISVADTIVPVVNCEPAVSVYLNEQGSASLTAIDLETSAMDNCTAPGDLTHAILRVDGTTTTTDTTFDCAAVGKTYTLTVKVLDEYKNAGTCTSVVTVRDTLLNHRGKDTIPADFGACVATLDATLDLDRVSGCTSGTLTGALQGSGSYQDVTTYNGMVLPTGTNYVVWTLDDGQGTVTVTDTLIVKDTQKPVLTRTTLMSNVERSPLECNTASAVSWDEPDIFITHATPDTLAKDNCTDASALAWDRVDTNLTRVVNGSGTVPVGRWKIQYVAKDEAGNVSDTLSFFVIVNNNNVPDDITTACPGAANGKKDTIFVEPACTAKVPARFTPEITGLCPGADSLSYAYTFNGGSDVTEGVGSLEGLNLAVGAYSVTYTASNKFAATPTAVTCDFTLWVRDTIKPTFDCPVGLPKNPVVGVTYTVDDDEFDLKNVTDNCGTYSVTNDYNSGATLAGEQFPTGHSYTIKWTVTDIHGNEDSCKVTLTFGDNVKPDITLNETPTVYLDDNGNGTLPMDSVIIHMSDNATDSSAIITTLTPDTFTCADIGAPVSATFTATDEEGNKATKVIAVTVLDSIAPKFILRNPTVYLDANGDGTLTMDSVILTLRDNCTDSIDIITSLSHDVAFTCDDIGSVSATFTAKDGHNQERSETVTVTVKDTITPQITCADEGNTIKKYTRAADCNYEVSATEFDPAATVSGCGSYTFSHNYGGGGATLAGALLPAGIHTITWTVTNLSGVAATCDVMVDVVDDVKPVITCPAPVSKITLSGSACTTTATIGALIYSDNCMPLDSLTWSIRCMGALRDSSNGSGPILEIPGAYPFSAGTNVITYTAVDKAGNRNTCSFTVPVEDVTNPTCVSVSNYTLKLQGPGITILDPKEIDNGSYDNCTAAPGSELRFGLSAGSASFTCADIGASRTVRLRVTDVSGRVHSCALTTTITVIDTIAPEPQCVSDTTLSVGSNGEISLSAAALNTNSSDNCTDEGALAYTFRRIVNTDTTYTADTTFTCAHLGANTVVVAVEDAYGNIGTCTVNVTVSDTLKPVIDFKRGKIEVPTTAGCEAILSNTLDPEIIPGSSCQQLSSITVTVTHNGSSTVTDTYAGMALSAGTHEITWTADAGGNLITTVKDTITVVDKLAPEVKGQMDPVNEQAVGNCESENEITWTLPENYPANTLVEDNCTQASALTWTRVDTNQVNVVWEQPAPAGKWKIQYVATDEAGNESDTVGFVLTVKVLANPTISDCHPSNTTLNIDAGECYATVPATFEPTIGGFACPNVDSLAYKITGGTFTEEGEGSLAGHTLPVGQYSATYTVFNITNPIESATCEFEIEVVDNAPPVVTCVADTSFALNNVGDDIVITAKELVALVTDCTPEAALTYTFDAAGAWLDTTYTRTAAGQSYPHMVYVLDESGNQGTCNVNVTIIDTIPPVIDLRPSVDVYLDVDGNGTLQMDDVIIHMKDNATDSIKIVTTLTPKTFTCSDIGVVSATFTATDATGNDTTAVITVTVHNTIKPVVNCNPDTTVVINAAGDAITLIAQELVTATAQGCVASAGLTYSFSNSAAEPSKDYGCSTLGDHPLTIYVTDANQNEASCTITVTVADTLPPVITKISQIILPASPATLNLTEVLDNYDVTDNCPASPTVTFKNVVSGDDVFDCTSNIGWIYAEDISGNKDSVMFTVFFDSSNPPTVTARDTTLYLDASGAATLSAYDVVKTVDDDVCIQDATFKNPANGLLTLDKTDFTCNDVSAQTVTVTLSAQGSALAPGTVALTVTVLDTLPPTITCAQDAAKMVDDATCSYKVIGTEFDPTATDNCGAYTFTHNYGGGGATLADTLLLVGTRTVTWTVTDVSGNTVTCPVTITVDDSTEPEITCKTDHIAYLDNDGNAVVNAEALIKAADDCAPQLTYSFDAYSAETHAYHCDDTVGVRSETIRVTDFSGNSSTCTAQFTVRDTLPPVIVLNNPVHLTAIINGTDVTTDLITKYNVLNPTTTDNCTTDFEDLVVDIVPKTYDCMVNTGTVTVTDKQGWSSSATFSVVLDGLPAMSVTAPDYSLTFTNGAATLSAYDVVKDIDVFCADKAAIMNPDNKLIYLSQSSFTCTDIGLVIEDTIFVKRNATATPETFTFDVTVHNTPSTITCTTINDPKIEITSAGCDTTLTDVAAAKIDSYASPKGYCYTFTNDKNGLATLEGANFDIGPHTITWTVSDNDGHSASCSKTLWVYDKHAPDIDCKDTTLALDASAAASIKAKDLIESVADNCSILTYTFDTGGSDIQYSCGDTAGIHTLTVRVADDASKVGNGATDNISTCVVQVQVKDTTPPVVKVKPSITVKVGEEVTPEKVITDLDDNCTEKDYMLDPANKLIRFEPSATYSCADVGSNSPSTVYVKDAAGNEASATFTVQVEPMKPAYVPLSPATVSGCNPDTSVANTGEIIDVDVVICGSAPATITHWDDASARGTVPADSTYYNYDIIRTWKVSAVGAEDSTSYQIISVRDDVPPVIVTASSLTIYLGQDGKGTLEPGEGLLKVEDCADSVYVTITFDPREFSCSDTVQQHVVTVTGRDPAGNESAPATITVSVKDTLPPVFTVNDPVTLLLDASGATTLTQSMALKTLRDNCTDSASIGVTFSRKGFYVDDIRNSPIYVWVYVEDQWGNKDSIEVRVNVIDDVARETIIEKYIQGRNVANRGDTVTFVITATNKFGSDRNLFIVDSLPYGLSLVEDKVPGNAFVDLTKKVITINHGFLDEGATVSYMIAARVEELGAWTNYAYLYRAEARIKEARATLNAEPPKLSLTANIREGDYISKQAGVLPSDAVYNVSGKYRLDITLKNEGGVTVNRIDVQIPYNPSWQRFEGSSRGAEVTDNRNGILTWTVNNFDGNFKADLELAFMPLNAATYTFVNSITTYLPDEDPSDNDALVTVNQIIVDVPNVVTSENPKLHIRGLENPAIEEVTMKTVNIWGNQVYFARYRGSEIDDMSTCWFEAGNLARGTYWYELVIRYENGSSHVIRDYVEVLK